MSRKKGDTISTPHHDGGLPAQGPIGLLIASVIWHGLKIDEDLKIWQQDEERIDFLETPYESLQPQLSQMAARARTVAEHLIHTPRTRGLREIGTRSD